VRWTQDVQFRAGRSEFTTHTDDGVRLYVDDRLILDAWVDVPDPPRVTTWVDAGSRRIRMEYYEDAGGSKAR